MRVLFLTQILPYPLTSGARIRAYYVLRQLARTNQVTLVSYCRAEDSPEAVAHLRGHCEEVITVPMVRSRARDMMALAASLIRAEPAVIVRDRLSEMLETVADLMGRRRFDAVHADQTSMAQFALHARSLAPSSNKPKLVLDQHNAMHLLVRRQSTYERLPWRIVWRREARRFEGYERDLCRRFDHVLTVTEEDRQALLALYAGSEAEAMADKLTPVPICVDPDSQGTLPMETTGAQIIHLGTMFWPPNVEGVLWFTQEVLPLIRRELPGTRFVVAGKDPPSSVRGLADDPGSAKADRGVVITGFVEDPKPLLQQSQVFIVPVRAGGGMRVKILDAWLWGIPVVSTTIGAEGLEVCPGTNILLADHPWEFAESVIQILTNTTVARQLREKGRRWVESHYDYREKYDLIDQVYKTLW